MPFPIELLDSPDPYRSGLPARQQPAWQSEPYPRTTSVRQVDSAMPGLAALIPLLLSIQGSSDPNVMKWREAQQAQTDPNQARSTPDMLMALQQLQQGQPKEPIDPNGMAMMTQQWKTMPNGQAAQPPADFAKIQELMDIIAKRGGRD